MCNRSALYKARPVGPFLPANGTRKLRVVSKAFTREDDDLGGAPVATPRPARGVRPVTPEGLRQLTDELASLDPTSRRAQVLAATLPLLSVQQPRCEDGAAAFGCWVCVRDESG